VYVGSGVTTRTWTPTLPNVAGTFEFRLFANDGYTRIATSPAVTLSTSNPVPTITTLNPSSVVAGASGFTLTVNGTGFVAGSVVKFDGSSRATTFGSSTQITAAITAGDIASATTHTITVFNPAPAGGTSSGSTLTVASPPSAPAITSINPTSVAAASAQFTLTINGSNFVNTSTVRVDGAARATMFVNSGQLTATILPSDVASSGTRTITVFTPAPGGGTSSGTTLTVTGPALTVNMTSAFVNSHNVIVTLTNGMGGGQDWLAIARTTDPNTTYLAWTYVGGGITSRTWNPTMPAVPGDYEFRLFSNNGYTRLATSPTVTLNPQDGVQTSAGEPGQH
jgi:hypothetical protein